MAVLLDDAIRDFHSKLEGGTSCPCCGRFSKLYKRNLNSSMAYGLLFIVKHHEWSGEWVNMPKDAPRWLVQTNQHPTLAWWGLIERKPNTDPSVKHSGLWRPTPKGIQFALRKITVPKFVITLHGEVQEFSQERVTIVEALGTKFDYMDIMGKVKIKRTPFKKKVT